MKSAVLLLFSVVCCVSASYKYYCTGTCDNFPANITTSPGLVLMGGGPDVDEAFIWMISKSKGGNFLVIRTDDDGAYNPYIFALGPLKSAATLCLFNRSASFDPFVVQTMKQADAIFMAGGDQWTYYSFWKDTPIQAIMNELANNVPIGGTSAGMESMGQFVNTAEFSQNEDLTSKDALKNPYNQLVTIGDDFTTFMFMENVLTDAHFFQRDRMGRLIVFLSRLLQDAYSSISRGIACDEGTALLVEPDGTASISSWFTNGSAYFLSMGDMPSICEPHEPLTVYNVTVNKYYGNMSNVFDLSRWIPLQDAGVTYTLNVTNGGITRSDHGSIY